MIKKIKGKNMTDYNTIPIEFKCHFCEVCLGHGCTAELPGMGGVFDSRNFVLNCAAWDGFSIDSFSDKEKKKMLQTKVRLAPITGALQNVGYHDEEAFYKDLTELVFKAGFRLSIGDGTPDDKLQFGIKAIQKLQEKKSKTKAAVFLKPYPNEKLFERIEWASPVAEILGIDIDAYNILTMRNLVSLEKKTASQMKEVQKKAGLPFAIKGVFVEEDIELVKELRPDIIVVSNHGGRVETAIGSSADFLAKKGRELRNYCGEIWVDGGVRKKRDIEIASFLGASEVLIGRPFITALCRGDSPESLKKTFS